MQCKSDLEDGARCLFSVLHARVSLVVGGPEDRDPGFTWDLGGIEVRDD